MIELISVSKNYGKHLAVDSVSFSIGSGEVVGFLGPNGAGKSTIMKMITSIISTDSGVLIIEGEDLSLDSAKQSLKVGYLPEDNPLPSNTFVREYLGFICDIYKRDKSRVESVIESTGLTPVANKKIDELSKGYRQRVGLAAAFIHNPKYLILDEPTTGLDPNQIVEIRALIKEYGKNNTVILSTHIMQEVEAICNRVILINKGRLISDKKIEEFSKGDYKKCKLLFEKPVDVDSLKSIDQVLEVEVIASNSFLIVHNNKQILFDLAKLSQEVDNQIIDFSNNIQTLEDSFRELTK